ncbi:nuclear GTP-binding protein nug1 [Coemansia spiralis]|uniref:Nuclear GTP-binding protein nug1 n=2 Tax=Coemansia TaxID=4863 RepID=A0A9W8G1K4_9FUNG|nr:P-loop containing nucleoside triphosphate hydrolase protein [Coemansia spiralis]KAJ1993219.1 nuclear GTP-binding protein nug1 [Coemansia umbellata]KAJ2622485.1 nuclear GTP-binding protein nug1 [Coemansia sp. RSA 1358]KAJ2676006.1 nuclear GTP-binding protein nug1 [Coemansia spiralis]
MVPKKHKSKRLTINQQKKIHKRATEKHRKDRRNAKSNPQRKKLKKDPGIPNLLPFKDKVLKQIEEHREQMEEEKKRQREARAQLHDKNRNINGVPNTMVELAREAQKRGAVFDSNQNDSDADDPETTESAVTGRKDNSKRAYYREFQKVVQHADVILEVLDARDPLGTRAPQIERMILDAGANKRIILILNKIDLVPRDVVEKWLAYLRHEFPTLAFKASTQEQRRNLGHAVSGSKKAATLSTSECVGADSLIQLLKNYSRNQKIKTSITVGIIGFPNVGKSSLINSLKRSRVCGVGSTPGFTKFVQEIHLDSKLKLMDCPGIVFNSPAKGTEKLDKVAVAEMMLRNCIKVELLDDPIAPVDLIVKRCKPVALQAMYNVPAFLDTRDFLVRLARQRGMLKRQGIADLEAAARIVLGDWNKGKIPYYTLPPGMTNNTASGKTAAGDAAAAHGAERAVVVSEWAKEFDIDALLGDMDTKVLADASTNGKFARGAMIMEGRMVANDAQMEDQMDEDSDSYTDSEFENSDAMEEDNEDDIAQSTSGSTIHIVNLPESRKAKTITRRNDKVFTAAEAAINPQSDRKAKELLKKQKKLAKAAMAQAADDDDEMAVEDSSNGNDDYDFGTYFQKPTVGAAFGAAMGSDSEDEDL